jgi:RNA polymerase sigma-70 factor (ECF subfamily)
VDSFVANLRAESIWLEPMAVVAEKNRGDGPEDEQLLERICSGDIEALAVLFHRYARVTLFIGRKILRDPDEADDFVQDLFLYIYRKCRVFDPARGSASSWIVQTIYYQALQRRMHIAARKQCSSNALETNGRDVTAYCSATTGYDLSLEGLMGRARLREMLESLTEDQWETLRLHFFEGYTLSEIAEKKEQTLGNIRHHFYRGLEKLRSSVIRGELKDRITSGKR